MKHIATKFGMLIALAWGGNLHAQIPQVPQADPKFMPNVAPSIDLAAYAVRTVPVRLQQAWTTMPATGPNTFIGAMTKLGWSLSGNKLRLTYVTVSPWDIEFPLLVQNEEDVEIPPLAPGEYELEIGTEALEGQYRRTDSRMLKVAATSPTLSAFSLTNRPTRKYFLTASAGDVSTLLAQRTEEARFGGLPHVVWAVAEETLRAWPTAGLAPSAAKPVCRFYHPSAITHFYSSNTAECELLKRTTPWVDEGTAFYALVPANGACPIGTDPVYRLFSASLGNHRYTRSVATMSAFAASGWVNEGAAFCSPKS